MKTKLISVILLLIVLSACGRNSAGTNGKQNMPVLNENGKEEITIGLTFISDALQETIVNYNKQSDRYEIIVYDSLGEISPFEARKRIQLDLANGKGPDVLSCYVLNDFDMTPYAEDGYLMDITDFAVEYKDLLGCVKDFNSIDGVVYGIPTAFELETVLVPSKLDISSISNTKERCMELTQTTKSTFGGDGYNFLEFFGVGINGIQLFVDEEKEISQFDSKEFIDLLEFAKRYECSDNGMTLQERLLSSAQIFLTCPIDDFSDFWFHEVLFDEIPTYIGFPSTEGGVNNICIESFYINSATEHEEGAKDFLKFLLSDEQQRSAFDEGAGFPVRKAVLEKLWDEAKTSPYTGSSNYIKVEAFGVEFEPRVMRDDDEELFFSMLEGNLIYDFRISVISDIVYEETAPFFEGKKTAEEVAKIIDNRVQLYLDEKK